MIGRLPFDFQIESWSVHLKVVMTKKRDHPVVAVFVVELEIVVSGA